LTLDEPRENVVASAIVDADGRLISADAAIASLNHRAGGELGSGLAIPQFATIARLAKRLGIVVSRGVVVADGGGTLDLWVRAQPVAGAVRLAITGWRAAQAAALPSADDFGIPQQALQWETDASLRITHVGGRGFGIEPATLLGKPLTLLFTLDEAADGALPILDAIARRRAFDDQPARIRESGRAVTLSGSLRRGADIGFAGFSGLARLVEDTVAPAPAPMPQGFTTGLDKVLRAPLSRIIANADSINAAAEGPVQQDYADYAADIAHAGRHLLGLVDDLVDLQAVEQPDLALTLEPIDLADVARRAAGLLSVRASNADVAIARPTVELAVPVQGDFRRSLQIMVNLIGNAVRYSPPGSVVTVTAIADGAKACAVIADQGKGIAPEDQERIFAKFERVDPTEPGGSGLGLYIARRLARAMGGDIAVESAPGEGSRFTLTLPYEAPRDEDQRQA
jgi:signal transduction histidine kinase